MITLICSHCDKEFQKSVKSYEQASKRGQVRFYCNQKCMGAAFRNTVIYNCDYCGKEVSKSKSNTQNKGKLFCSRSCNGKWKSENKVGENACYYKHGRKNSIGTYRQKALDFHGNKCAACGYSQELKLIEVHHVDSNRANNDISNLIPLCHWCHKCITRGVPIHSNTMG